MQRFSKIWTSCWPLRWRKNGLKGTTGSSAGAFMMITAHALCAMINISSGVCVHGVARHAHRLLLIVDCCVSRRCHSLILGLMDLFVTHLNLVRFPTTIVCCSLLAYDTRSLQRVDCFLVELILVIVCFFKLAVLLQVWVSPCLRYLRVYTC